MADLSPVPQPLTTLSEEESLLQAAVRDFARSRVRPLVAQMEHEKAIPRALIDELFALGVMGSEVPIELGGAGSNFVSAILSIEALAEVDPSVSVLVDVQNTLVQNTLLRAGTAEQKARYLPQLCQSWVGSYALSEAGSGSDAFALQTEARKDGSGYRLSGEKLWITSAAESSLFIVFANVDKSLGYKGITAFLVERDQAGFSILPREDKLGIVASSTCPLLFENCFVAEENVLGPVGLGYKIAIETLNEGRIGIGAQMLGLAQAAFNHAVKHVSERKQFGKAIKDFQGVQFQLARLRTHIEAARLLVYNAARLKDANKPLVAEAAMAKYYASEVAEEAASLAVDLLGGVGFTKEYPVEKLYRDAKIGKIYEGTSNMQLLTIAKHFL